MEKLLPAFDVLREKHMRMAVDEFNVDTTNKAGMNRVGRAVA